MTVLRSATTLALVKPGCMLEGLSIPRYSSNHPGSAVTKRWVQIISRKGHDPVTGRGILRDCTPGAPSGSEDTVRAAWRHAEAGGNDRPLTEQVRVTSTERSSLSGKFRPA